MAARIYILKQPYGGYAPETEFVVVRSHAAPVLTASPVDHPFRAITIPAALMERKS